MIKSHENNHIKAVCIVIFTQLIPFLPLYHVQNYYLIKGRHKRESKNAKQMLNTKQNCFSHSSASPRNNKQCSAKQCFANQTNRCLAGFASRSDLCRDNARLKDKYPNFEVGLKCILMVNPYLLVCSYIK